MNQKTTLPENQISWIKFLDKNFSNNRQLDFTGQMFLSCTNPETGEADSDMLKLTQVNRTLGTLNFAVDMRSDFAKNIQNSKFGCVSVYFPLSREKMKLVGTMFTTEQTSNPLDIDCGKLKEEIWNRLGSEEKKTYKAARPDLLLSKNDALNTFNSPEVVNIPENFSVFVVYPHKGKFENFEFLGFLRF